MQSRNLSRKIHPARFITVQIGDNARKKPVLLAVPKVCTDKIITLYHTSLFAGH